MTSTQSEPDISPPPVPTYRRPTPRAVARRVSPGQRRLGVRKELSAGGVVARQENGVWFVALLMTEHKRGKVWVLPKGHVELATRERISDAARREVEEEAGVRDLSVKNQLGVTRFRFQAETAVVYKTVHYFLMTTQQKELTPQVEEGLLEARWFLIDEAIKNLQYDTDQDIVRRARDILTGVSQPPAPFRRPMTPRGPRRIKIRT